MEATRIPTAVTLSVWKALFLREAVFRLFGSRAAWVWLLVEPAVHIGFLMMIFSVIRIRVVGGINTAVWVMVGLLAFFMFRRVGMQAMNAVGANQSLFSYRQVKPVDTVLTRAGLEGFLMIVIILMLCIGAGFLGLSIVPVDPLMVLEAFLGLWLMGLGFGLISSVASELVPEIGKVIGLVMTPLYMLSGVIMPLSIIPLPYRDWLMLNPVAHGIEAARLGFSPLYQAVPSTSLGFLYVSALLTVFLGLALHDRFSTRLGTA